MDKPVYLVSCVAEKAAGECAAKDLYVSDWFKKARAYVEATECDWYILSACYTVLRPDRIVAPYEMCLDEFEREWRKQWATTAAHLIRSMVPFGTQLIILAGGTYREFLVPSLLSKGYPVEVPMQGLGIGQQKQWLMSHTPCEAQQGLF